MEHLALSVVLLLLCGPSLRSAHARAAAGRVVPEHAVNLTMYHVGPSTHRGLANVNSGDAAGDAFFMLRAAGLPWLCSNSSGLKDETFDCRDVEQSGGDLLVSEFVIEADSRFSGYAECNTENGTGYFCDCRQRSGGGGFSADGSGGGGGGGGGGGTTRGRQLQHHHHSSVPCNATVGRISVLEESSFANQPPDPSQPSSWMNSPYRFWCTCRGPRHYSPSIVLSFTGFELTGWGVQITTSQTSCPPARGIRRSAKASVAILRRTASATGAWCAASRRCVRSARKHSCSRA